MSKPLCIDLFSGLGGWAEAFVSEGYLVVGFDLYNMFAKFGLPRIPGCDLVLQDVLTLHGSQFKNAAVIVASPPCQEFSYMAMPWKRSKQIAWALYGENEFPEGYTGSRSIPALNALFDACFRIQREASEAAGHHVPMVVENVRGAEPWVGKAQAHFGSFYLWGDVRRIGNRIVRAGPLHWNMESVSAQRGGKTNPDGTAHGQGSWFAQADSKNRGSKNTGGSWFSIGSPGQTVTSQNPVNGVKVPGLNWSGSDQPGYIAKGFNTTAAQRLEENGLKHRDQDGYERNHENALGWKAPRTNSKSPKRALASAQIAKIPPALAGWVARAFKPVL